MLLIATHNQGKFIEISQILAPIPCQSAKNLNLPSPEEIGLSFIENALIKARAASYANLSPCIADDSGLVVPALDGRPGIYSARFAGLDADDAQHRQLLLHEMKHLHGAQRKAYFYCVMVYIKHHDDPTPLIGIGQWDGEINMEEQGANGFGYDPLFYLPHLHKTAAQLSSKEKNQISHRAQALKKLATQLHSIK
jgi:XTP/dITP diphosphohydrolase